MNTRKSLLTMFAATLAGVGVFATDIVVEPGAYTIEKALQQAREERRLNHATDICLRLQAGTYLLNQPIVVRPEDSGTRIVADGNAIISGGVRISGWKKEGKYYVADVPDFNGRPLEFRQMWVNSKKAVRARDVADFDDMYRIKSFDKAKETIYVPAAAVKKITGARYAEMVLHEMWCVANLRIKDIQILGDSAAVTFHQPESHVHFMHPWPSPMVTPDGHNSAFYLTNAKELLDTEGEWYLDARASKLYYIPREGEDMASAEVIVPAVETLLKVEGTPDSPVKNVTFEGITFSHATWLRPSTSGHAPLQAGMYMTEAYKLNPKMDRPNGDHKLDNQGWVGRPAAAVSLNCAEGVSFTRCTFEHNASTGLDYHLYIKGGSVDRCTFRDMGGSGILAGSFGPEGHEAHLPYAPTDERIICTGLSITNNLITDVTNDDWGCVGIGAGFVKDIKICNNEISEVSYTGISIGWGWNQQVCSMSNNLVKGNLIHHYAKHMYDTAGIYTLGSQPNSSIIENVVRDIYTPSYVHDPNHWFYLYTDEGSSYITVRDNWTPAEKFLKNANGPGNTWENNGPAVADSIKAKAGITPVQKDMATTSKATWIWYPGDYEIWLGNKMNNRRTDRGAYFPPFWKQDSHYVTVEFSKAVSLDKEETLTVATEGDYNIKIDGKMLFGMPKRFTLGPGEHRINIKVHNQATPPALYVCGNTVNTDETWNVTFEDKEWIDESGKASDTSSTVYMKAGRWNFDAPEKLPSEFKLARREETPANGDNGLYDFGRETFGYAILHGINGNGTIEICYGESEEEALDKEHCETLDKLVVENGEVTDLATGKTTRLTDKYTMSNSKAFRYIYINTDGCTVTDVSMDYEYMPETEHGTFRCNDEELNKIWEVGAYTMQLTSREFFIDGIKRDRWVWSGDASQSYLMNFYLFNDNEMVKRTMWLLAGKAPITSHINTIMDYTFYWFNSVHDYYLYSGDRHFLTQIYPTMQTYMAYVLGRIDEDGMVEGLPGDWVFIDWADKPMDKQGQLAFEQILFRKSLESIAAVAHVVGDEDGAKRYRKLADDLGEKLLPYFWNEDKQALVHNRKNGKQGTDVFRYPNMFAIMYGYLGKEKQEAVKRSVMLNDDVLKITTPYMRFYELEALCILGEQDRVMEEIKAYWGGMLREGATSFWEKYNPDEHGRDRLAMYGRPYGKSLCHAWGASPIYLLGRYYLGVEPTKPGFEEYTVRPKLGGLEWMEGTVPTPFGTVYVRMDGTSVTVKADGGHGSLIIGSPENERIIEIQPGKETIVNL